VIVPYALGYDFWFGWLIWFGLVFFLGLGHPSTVDAHTPLDRDRRVMAWATIGLFILTFTPVPFAIVPPSPTQLQQQQQPPQQPQDPSQQTPGISVMLRLPSGQSDQPIPSAVSSNYRLTRAVDLQSSH
jgi:hypothetical protein